MEFDYLADRKEAIPLIAGWYFSEWGHLHGIQSPEESEKMLSNYLNKDKIPLILLAKDDDRIVGAVQLKYYEMDIYPNKEHWLGGVFVLKEYRGKQVAERLIEKAVEVAKKREVNILYLQTEKLDGGLYKRLGWRPVEKVNHRNKPVLVMKKTL